MAPTADTAAGIEAAGHPPAIVLVRPQLPVNVGSAARAMLSLGLGDLRLVAPEMPWPNDAAHPAASGADSVLARAGLYGDVAAAVADCRGVWATTARPRELPQPVLTARDAGPALAAASRQGQPSAILFGNERTGLTNAELAIADSLITIPLAEAATSLNLAQAVMIVAYEWAGAAASAGTSELPAPTVPPARAAEVTRLRDHILAELEARGFFHVPAKRPRLRQRLEALLRRPRLTAREVRLMHAVIDTLARRPRQAAPSRGLRDNC